MEPLSVRSYRSNALTNQAELFNDSFRYSGDRPSTVRLKVKSSQVQDSIFSRIWDRTLTTIGDSMAGIGAAASSVLSSGIFQYIAPRIQTITTGLSRFGGGVASALAMAPRVYNAWQTDQALDNGTYRNTQREVVASMGSIGAGSLIAYGGAAATTALIGLSAPVAVVAGAGILTVAGTLAGAYYAREGVNWLYDRVYGS